VFFVVLTAIHVWANIRALRCLVLSSLNEPRLKLLLGNWETKVHHTSTAWHSTTPWSAESS
jgi:hypothetical protein